MSSKDEERRFLITIGNATRSALFDSVVTRLQDKQGSVTEEQLKVWAALVNRMTSRQKQDSR
jgi:hypothetical protein